MFSKKYSLPLAPPRIDLTPYGTPMAKSRIYVLSTPEVPGHVHIGVSGASPADRIAELQDELGTEDDFQVDGFATADAADDVAAEVIAQLGGTGDAGFVATDALAALNALAVHPDTNDRMSIRDEHRSALGLR